MALDQHHPNETLCNRDWLAECYSLENVRVTLKDLQSKLISLYHQLHASSCHHPGMSTTCAILMAHNVQMLFRTLANPNIPAIHTCGFRYILIQGLCGIQGHTIQPRFPYVRPKQLSSTDKYRRCPS